MPMTSRFCSLFSSRNLSRERESVDKEQLSEVLELLDLLGRQLFVVVNALIPIKTDEVRPFFQVRGKSPAFRKKINSPRQGLACARLIQLASGCVERLAEHGSCGICVSTASIVEPLNERAFHHLRDALRCFELIVGGVLPYQRGIRVVSHRVEIAGDRTENPVALSDRVQIADAQDLAASVATEHRSALDVHCRNHINRSHRDIACPAMWAVSNKCHRHIRSVVAQFQAYWSEA